MKKRILSLVLAVLMVLAVTGCRGADPAPSSRSHLPQHSRQQRRRQQRARPCQLQNWYHHRYRLPG